MQSVKEVFMTSYHIIIYHCFQLHHTHMEGVDLTITALGPFAHHLWPCSWLLTLVTQALDEFHGPIEATICPLAIQ